MPPNTLTEKMKIDSGVASKKQSPRKPEAIPVGSRSGRPSQPPLGRPWPQPREISRENPKAPGSPRKSRIKMEMMFWICHVTSTPRKMKRVTLFTQSIPLDSVDS